MKTVSGLSLLTEIFSPKGRVGTWTFGFYFALGAFVYGVLTFLFYWLYGVEANTLWIQVWMLPLDVIIGICAIKRYHDLGKNGWYALQLLIPIYSIVVIIRLCFQSGKAEKNLYGEQTLPVSFAWKTLTLVIFVISVGVSIFTKEYFGV